jgi:predicted 3-demethylubiquinone-9 3-methyltransferase (glyoxalase superfamily)
MRTAHTARSSRRSRPDSATCPEEKTMQLNAQKIRPFLWFDNQAEEAAHFYASIFKNSKIDGTLWNSGSAPVRTGAMSVTFELEGQQFIALNGGPHFSFTPAISFFVRCETQAEVDELWEKLGASGEPGQCGWLKDKFGVSWQIVPTVLGELLEDEDEAKAERTMNAMLQMTKLDIAKLKAAAG